MPEDTDCTQISWSTLAWNGIHLDHPCTWELTRLEKNYLMLEDAGGPVLDLKWEPARGNRPLASSLKQMVRRSRRTPLTILPADRLSPGWQTCLDTPPHTDAQILPFAWSSSRTASPQPGCLIMQDNPDIQAMLRFHHPETESRTRTQAGSLIRSLITPPAPGLWQFYDIRFILPEASGLDYFSLHPGHYRLVFSSKKTRMVLDRLGPADVILDHKNLTEWISRFHHLTSTRCLQILTTREKAPNEVTWQCVKQGFLHRRAEKFSFFTGRRRCLGRAWIPPFSNKILSLEICGKERPSAEYLTTFCREYGIV